MHDTTVARSYASALFELGEKHGSHDELTRGLDTVTTLLESDARIRHFFDTPKIDVTQKQQALRSALGRQVSPMFMNFVLVVLRKRRQRLMSAIAAEYRELLDEKLGRLHVRVTMAHQPDAAAEREIVAQLTRILGRDVIAHVTVDPALLGGIVVRYGDRVIDGSLRRRLLSLRSRLVNAALPLAGQPA